MWRTVDESERSCFFRRCLVLREEEYENLGRMTAEKCEEGHVAITCVIFGATIQAICCEEDEFPSLYNTMRAELTSIFESDLTAEEKKTAYRDFFSCHAKAKVYRRISNGL